MSCMRLVIPLLALVAARSADDAAADPRAGSGGRSFVPPPLPRPAPAVGSDAPISLPPLPSFELPPSEPGFRSPRELLVAGRRLLGTEVKAKGYITWIYDCVADVRRARETRAQTQRRIDADPTQCERPKLYLGNTRDESRERSIWVVDVPRPPNKLEKRRLPREEIAAWPKVPRLAVGDFVTITGTWALSSPHSERNSDGLLVFEAIEAATPGPQPATTAPPRVRPTVAAVSIKPIAPRPVDERAYATSISHANRGMKAHGGRQYDVAVTEYSAAVAAWDANYVAWYGLAGALIGRKDWSRAGEAIRHAVELVPDEPMYHLIYGLVLYEQVVAQATEDQARQHGGTRMPPDLSAVSLDSSMQHFAHAIKLEPRLWRAHHGIGRIHRDHGDARWAAESFDAAVRCQPTESAPWIAMIELYRQWGYTDQALAVAVTATTFAGDSADVWYVLGMAHDDKGSHVDAIAAFTRTLEIAPDHHKAMFQRGRAYFRARDYPKATVDLQSYVSAGTGDSYTAQQAKVMLRAISAQRR
jgi:tetratricopeptide (TPR) repeat protein